MPPLSGIKVIEFASLAPGPFCGMLLADLGAEVVRIDRHAPGGPGSDMLGQGAADTLGRGKRSIAIDLKHDEGLGVAKELVDRADVLIEGFRPGVMERLGLGPDECLARNARLIYGRLTGYGQDGPYARSPGHDINYLALAGVLDQLGPSGEPPQPPLNLLADFAGGGLLLAFGICAALFQRAATGQGQVLDAAMVDGAALLSTWMHGNLAAGRWRDGRGNLVSPVYRTYETSDGKYVSVAAGHPGAFAELISRLGLTREGIPSLADQSEWADLQAVLAGVFKTKTRAEWCEVLEETETYFAPVLALGEASKHPHNRQRQTFVEVGGVSQPAPAPRFSGSQLATPAPAPAVGQHGTELLLDAGFAPGQIDALRAAGAVA
jgi:alpha-methylacyl-CoA racemase